VPRRRSEPPPTPIARRDLAAALEEQRERAVEAEEELRLVEARAREAEKSARRAEEELRVLRARVKEAEATAEAAAQEMRQSQLRANAAASDATRDGTHAAACGVPDVSDRRSLEHGAAQQGTQPRRASVDSIAEGDGARSNGERDRERLARALDKVQSKSKDCARLQAEVHQLEEVAESLQEGEKERERLLRAKTQECVRLHAEVETLEAQVEALRLRHAEIERDSDTQCSRLRAEVEALEEQVETLKQRQMDIEREADMAAELLLQAEAEGAAHLSATALVKEALANKSDGAVSATARVRDALAHHLKAGGNR
jgi:predicted  nucleic acid-binding Zn-ribbon protein